jgi:hypothetical protein
VVEVALLSILGCEELPGGVQAQLMNKPRETIVKKIRGTKIRIFCILQKLSLSVLCVGEGEGRCGVVFVGRIVEFGGGMTRARGIMRILSLIGRYILRLL